MVPLPRCPGYTQPKESQILQCGDRGMDQQGFTLRCAEENADVVSIKYKERRLFLNKPYCLFITSTNQCSRPHVQGLDFQAHSMVAICDDGFWNGTESLQLGSLLWMVFLCYGTEDQGPQEIEDDGGRKAHGNNTLLVRNRRRRL